MTKWHSTKTEDKPKGSVLLLCGSGTFTHMISGSWEEDDQEWYDDNDGDIVSYVTHWSILPGRPV